MRCTEQDHLRGLTPGDYKEILLPPGSAMRPNLPFRSSGEVSGSWLHFLAPGWLCLVLLLCLTIVSCGNSCVIGVFNPNGTIIVAGGNCNMQTGNGTMAVRAAVAPAPEGVPSSAFLQHVFITIRGIEANPNSISDDDSPDWVEIAPNLARHPVQVDLMSASVNSCESNALSRSVVPANVYRQIRIRLAPDHLVAGESAPVENHCGEIGFHCVIVAGGEMRRLAWNSTTPNLHISSKSISGDGINLLPDSETNITI